MTENASATLPVLPRIVCDTNLIVSALMQPLGNPRRVLDAWRVGRCVFLATDAMLVEYEDVLFRPRFARKFGISPNTAAGFLFRTERQSTRITPLPDAALPITVRDPKDNHLLAAALGGGATHIVTGDQDLLTLDGHPALGALRIVTARAFLDLLTE